MIVLDTNVLSELMRSRPHPALLGWLRRRPRSLFYTTSISKAEIRYGIAAMPEGRRRLLLAEQADEMFKEDFAGRVLAFDDDAASLYADARAARQRAGRPMSVMDALIAAIALSAGAAVATRDVGGFAGCGVELINPWEAT
jgi:predicted nucleic acid-binding protein